MKKIFKPALCFLFCLLIIAVDNHGKGLPGESVHENPIYRQLRNIKLSGKAVPVQNLVLKRDTATITFKEGTFYLLEEVENRYTGAVFSGSGTFRMSPVPRVEQEHLRHLTGTGSIEEQFSYMFLRFTDETYKEITANRQIQEDSKGAKAENYLNKTRKFLRKGKVYSRPNIAIFLLGFNLDLRLLTDLTRPGGGGFFYSFFKGKKYGNLLFTIDPLGMYPVKPEEVVLACLGEKNLGIWVAEHRQEYYKEKPASKPDHRFVDMEHYDIDAATRGNSLQASVTARFTALVDGPRVIPFYLFQRLRVEAVTGSASGLLPFVQEKYNEDADFAIILPEGLKKGKQYTVTFEYRGNEAVIDEGGGNYTLVARSTWFPVADFADRATFNITLRTPVGLEVVATGQPVDREIRGDWLISRWKSDIPLLNAGFNYGKFKKSVVKDEMLNVTIESYANTDMPDQIKDLQLLIDRLEFETGQQIPFMNLGSLNTVRLMDKIRAEAQMGVRLYWNMFGPMPFDRIAITQQPFPDFGQAWPMLVYMPIIAYFSNTQLEQLGLTGAIGFIKNACAHEVGHQWWGHTVGYDTYRSQWLSEALAQVSASLFTQVVYKNAKFIEYWRDLRKNALRKNRKGKCPSKIGSVTLGYRLDTGRTGNVSNAALYAKGAFVIHMLRMMMWHPKTGDREFSAMLKDFVKTYYKRDASTEDFIRMVEKHMTKRMDLDGNGKMDWFFNQWLHGTMIPEYKLDYRVKKVDNGTFLVSCKITQDKVDDSFKMLVPIYGILENGKLFRLASVKLKGNGTSPEISFKLPIKPEKIFLCAMEDVLCTIKKGKEK